MDEQNFTPILRYDKMVETALRSVVTSALQHVIDKGLPGEHHFYITFLTHFPGVNIPSYLVEQYPDEMTIVLQYQFYGLEVDNQKMAVTLSFNNVPERLEIPLEAITIFADPSVNFALQFQPMDSMDDEDDDDFYEDFVEDGDVPSLAHKAKESSEKSVKSEKEKSKTAKNKGKENNDKGKVISLDSFRKKD